MAIRLLITYILNLVDLVFTTIWVKKYGIEIEANPIGRWLYEKNAAVFVKVGVVGAILFRLYKLLQLYPKWEWTSWVLLAVYSALVLYHIVIFLTIKKNLKGEDDD